MLFLKYSSTFARFRRGTSPPTPWRVSSVQNFWGALLSPGHVKAAKLPVI